MNKRIKELRQTLNLSQDEFAQAIGLSKSGISALESGTRKVNGKHIRMLEITYNVNPQWILTGEGDIFKPVEDTPIAAIKDQYHLSAKACAVLNNFLKLSPSEQDTFIDLAQKVFDLND